MTRRIVIRVPRRGIVSGQTKTTFDVQGFQGEACLAAMAQARGAMGITDQNSVTEAKMEMHNPPEQEREYE